MQAYGGYIEGFLPAQFGIEAIAADDKILAFLSLSDEALSLTAGKDGNFELKRGPAKVKFTAGSETAMPNIPAPPDDALVLDLPGMLLIDALMDCVPKTGWGAMNNEMLGAVVDPAHILATDNTSLAFAETTTQEGRENRLILPRPFCMALTQWTKALGDKLEVSYTDTAIYAVWESGEVLMGALPVIPEGETGMQFDGMIEEAYAAPFAVLPADFNTLLAEAAIFSDDIIFESKNKQIQLSTPGPISWHRTATWTGGSTSKAHVLPLKRLATALEYCHSLSIGTNDRMVYLRNDDTGLYVIIATK